MLDYQFFSACGPVLHSSGMLFSNPGSRAYFASRRLGHRSHQSGAMQKIKDVKLHKSTQPSKWDYFNVQGVQPLRRVAECCRTWQSDMSPTTTFKNGTVSWLLWVPKQVRGININIFDVMTCHCSISRHLKQSPEYCTSHLQYVLDF